MPYVLARCVELLLAVPALVLLSPILLVIAIVIRRTSPGPAIFRQERVGWRGRRFMLYKFRTMRTDADPYGFSPTDGSDPRLTRVGRWLRETSLDELPQLVNVLKGDMALVGPRPLLGWQYERWTERQRRRCDVRPGLTGWAQIRGRGDVSHEEKIELDLWYVEHRSVWLDLKILVQTALLVFRRKTIYETNYHGRGGKPAPPKSDADGSESTT
ncbi:MAG: sugar transferase [Phycisphaerae bacterium]|nr:sugar transferase [Phycisphaerae bacterium]